MRNCLYLQQETGEALKKRKKDLTLYKTAIVVDPKGLEIIQKVMQQQNDKSKPKGGTELQLEYLSKYVDKELLDKVQITTSVPEKIPLHPTKPNVLLKHLGSTKYFPLVQ